MDDAGNTQQQPLKVRGIVSQALVQGETGIIPIAKRLVPSGVKQHDEIDIQDIAPALQRLPGGKVLVGIQKRSHALPVGHIPPLLLAIVFVVHRSGGLIHLTYDRVQCVLAVLCLNIDLAEALQDARDSKHRNRAGRGGIDHDDAQPAGAVALRLSVGQLRIPHAPPDREQVHQHGDEAQRHGIADRQRPVQALHAHRDDGQHLDHGHILGFRRFGFSAGIDASIGNAVDLQLLWLLPKLVLVDPHLGKALEFVDASIGLQQCHMPVPFFDQQSIAIKDAVGPLQPVIVYVLIAGHVIPVNRLGGHFHIVQVIGDSTEGQEVGFGL